MCLESETESGTSKIAWQVEALVNQEAEAFENHEAEARLSKI